MKLQRAGICKSHDSFKSTMRSTPARDHNPRTAEEVRQVWSANVAKKVGGSVDGERVEYKEKLHGYERVHQA
jgi:hypothetical protein